MSDDMYSKFSFLNYFYWVNNCFFGEFFGFF